MDDWRKYFEVYGYEVSRAGFCEWISDLRNDRAVSKINVEEHVYQSLSVTIEYGVPMVVEIPPEFARLVWYDHSINYHSPSTFYRTVGGDFDIEVPEKQYATTRIRLTWAGPQ